MQRWRSSNIGHGDVSVLKDNFVTTDLPTTCASNILDGFKGNAPCTVARLLQDEGIKNVAKSNMDEFGMGSHSMNSAWGPVKNGVDKHALSVGGSSGGSAFVVAAGKARFAIGSDTGGSVRLPAAYTGIVGFKPSYGRISRNGLVPYANSLDTVGIMTTRVMDTLTIFKMLNKYDQADPTSLTPESRQRIVHAQLSRIPLAKQSRRDHIPIRVVGQTDDHESNKLHDEAEERWKLQNGLYGTPKVSYRIGVPDEYNIEEMHPLVRHTWLKTLSALHAMGNDIVHLSLPTTQQALAAYYVLAPAEASSNLAKYDGVRYGKPRSSGVPDNHDGPLYADYRGENFGEEVKRRILLGTFSLSAGAMDNYFIQAQKVRRLVQHDFNSVFSMGHPLMNSSKGNSDGVDFIVVPTAPTIPPLLSEVEQMSSLDSFVNDVFTVPASLAGLPAISVPVHSDDDLPATPERNIGMQVIGQFGDDVPLLNFTRYMMGAIDPPRHDHIRIWNRSRI